MDFTVSSANPSRHGFGFAPHPHYPAGHFSSTGGFGLSVLVDGFKPYFLIETSLE
jgi:hypothetical protein